MTVLSNGGAAGLGFVIPLTKIDVERRMVYGVAAQGDIIDKSKEIMDYATAKPAFQAWSSEIEAATGGMSKGNLRAMHTKTVAGTIPEISFDDANKTINIGAHVVRDDEWALCLKGGYTGFSVGGGYARKWTDPATGCTRYTPIVREMSLVDSPCIPTARFAELVKADGVVEHLPLVGKIPTFADAWSSRPLSFAEQWAARPEPIVPPMTFGELVKYDNSKHPREHDGKFASKTGEVLGRTFGGAAGVLGGYALGSKYGPSIGERAGEAAAHVVNATSRTVSGKQNFIGDINREYDEIGRKVRFKNSGKLLGGKYGQLVGGTLVGIGGILAGSAMGAAVDRYGRRNRAIAAGRLDQYERLNADTSILPNKRKQMRRALEDAKSAGRKVSAIHDMARQAGLTKRADLLVAARQKASG